MTELRRWRRPPRLTLPDGTETMRPKSTRRVAMIRRLAVFGVMLAALATSAAAQSNYPSRPIQLVGPYGPGGVADVGMRIMTERLSIRLKQNVVVENRPGAGGIIAAKAVASSAPDGYNVLMTGNNNAIAVGLFKSLPYDILKDFAPTSTVSFFDLLIIVKACSPTTRSWRWPRPGPNAAPICPRCRPPSSRVSRTSRW